MPEKRNGKMMLTPEEKKTLLEMEPGLIDLEMELQRAKRAGMDVKDIEEEVKKAKTIRIGLLREYG